ncbi:MAG TPA: methyltransferase [Pyrinomonadaceae bacterium]|nr:methyltransferase [Pyrinomonadaceae bacterium]
MSTPQGAPSPILFFDTVNAYQRTAAVRAAVELELFTAVGEGNMTAREIAERCKASERGVRILCDYLTVVGFLQKASGHYALTPDSEVFLDKRSPAYVGGAVEFLLSPTLLSAFDDLTSAVRKGGTTMPDEGSLAPEHPVWVSFARGMAPLQALPAQILAGMVEVAPGRDVRLLDVAAGHGLFGVAFARQYENVRVVAQDWKNVLAVAQENARAAGVEARFETLPGSVFDVELGGPYDLILLTNFLHHADVPTCEGLLRKLRGALADGGRVVTVEFVPDEDRVSPPAPAMFPLVMLASTPAGDAYTFSEFESMFRNAGYSRSELRPLLPGLNHVIISHK